LKFVEVRVSDDVQDVGKQQFTAQRMVLFTRLLTVVIFTAQHPVSPGDPSEQEVRFSGMADHHFDQRGDSDICL
jgi:hypothetical protein